VARTAYLTVNFRQVVPVGVSMRFEASVDRVDGRKRFVTGRLYDGETLLADGEALFVELRPGQP
jgi:acyl-coenzyme A thioesterase PaaI-like protein